HLLGNAGDFLVCLTMVFQLLFTASFLNLKQYYPKLNKTVKILILFFVIMCLVTLLNRTFPIRGVIYSFTLLSFVFLFSVGLYCWQKKHRSARFFIIATFAYIAGVLIVLLYSLNVLDIYFKVSVFRPDNIGQMIFFTLLSFAIGDKINILKREKAEAQERSLEVLEEKVKERTIEVVNQKHLIEEKHKEITDSINYAERIQKSFLATKEQLDKNLKEYFVLFQPKDVVSGDFYWASILNNGCFVLVTADSTGHGVPGAIMSLLNITSLEKAVENLVQPAEILNQTRKTIIERLKKDGSIEGGKDGMDCSLISFDFKNNKLIYSAANNPVWIVRENSLIEFSPDKMPVGKHDKDNTPFTQHEVTLQRNDVIYAITDGMPDQFGGPNGKKYKYKQLKELFVSISHLPLKEQKTAILASLNSWKGDLEQVDDITVIGVRI
ncbi:MAG: PP2C family protein-serine/threonine phosphatase, partial [Bacteroidia bacterium]